MRSSLQEGQPENATYAWPQVGDRTGRVWVRLVGGAVLLAIVVASIVIVGRDTPTARRPPSPQNERDVAEPEEQPELEASTGIMSPREIGRLQACIAEDATFTEKAPGKRLRKLLQTSRVRQRQRAAYADLVEVASDVEQLRGFRFSDPVTTNFVSSRKVTELAAKPALTKKTRAARVEDLVLTALGVLRPSQHLRKIYSELISDQVAGFYKPRTNELVVPSPGSGEGLTPFDKSVLAHELEHALIDQRVGFSNVLPPRLSDRDGSLAALAVIEGSATLTGTRWTQAGLGFFDQLELVGDPRVTTAELPTSVPYYLLRQFSFPYFEGLQFVCDLYRRGGWKLVNRAILNPPATTLEILSPGLYVSGHKRPRVREPSSPGPGWKHDLGTTFGAANWVWLLEAPRNDPGNALVNAEGLATEWAGGMLHVWTKSDEAAVAVMGKTSGGDLCVSLMHWYEASFGDEGRSIPGREHRRVWQGEVQSAAIACSRNEIRFGVAPSGRAVRRMVFGD